MSSSGLRKFWVTRPTHPDEGGRGFVPCSATFICSYLILEQVLSIFYLWRIIHFGCISIFSGALTMELVEKAFSAVFEKYSDV